VNPAQAIAQAQRGELLPVYVVVGEERFLRDQVVQALRTAALGGGVAAFNEDKFTAGEAQVNKVVAAARTVPMMANKRFVLVRGGERWDGVAERGGNDAGLPPLDVLAAYAQAPIDSTCLVVVFEKIDGRRKLATQGKKA